MYKEFGKPYLVTTPNDLFDWVESLAVAGAAS